MSSSYSLVRFTSFAMYVPLVELISDDLSNQYNMIYNKEKGRIRIRSCITGTFPEFFTVTS